MDDISKYFPLWGGWNIGEPIGKGSFGTVYQCYKNEFGKTYLAAVKHISIPQEGMNDDKVIYEGYATDEHTVQLYYDKLREEFANEINLCEELKGNTNIVSYEDSQTFRKQNSHGYDIFIRMELLTGLPAYRRTHKMTETDVIKLGIDICRALELLNSRHIIHRDIKPGNIFVNKDGTYKLGDFGESKIIRGTKSSMSVRGTYAYMSPEVSRGGKADIRADIYSLGLVMYRELNANKPPFVGSNMILTADMAAKSDQLRFQGNKPSKPDLCSNEALWSVISYAIEYDPDKRWRNPREMRKALEGLLNNDESISYPKASVTHNTDPDATVSGYDNIPYSSGQIGPPEGMKQYDPYGQEPTGVMYNQSPGNRNMKIIIILLSVILAIIVGVLLIWIGTQVGSSGGTVTETSRIENYVGKAYESVKEDLEDKGYTVVVNYKESDAPEGEILDQSPEENNLLLKNDTVKLTVSKGNASISDIEYESSYPSDSSVNTEIVSNDSRVSDDIKLSDYTGKSSSQAQSELGGLGLKTEISEEYNDTTSAGNVIRQTPASGTTVKKGSKVILYVSKGKDSKVTMPNLVGMNVNDASSKLSELGLKVNLEKSYDLEQTVDKVISQSISKNKTVEKGTEVTISYCDGAGFSNAPYGCSQLIYLNCSGAYGKMRIYNLEDGRWIYQGVTFETCVGSAGVADQDHYNIENSHTPAGCFAIGRELTASNTSSDTVIIEEPSSQYYNCIVSRSLAGNSDYDPVGANLHNGTFCGLLFIEQNGDGSTRGEPNKGSSITICGKNSSIKPTGGCIDISSSDYYTLDRIMDRSKDPYILIQ